jgi:hypothetical protein
MLVLHMDRKETIDYLLNRGIKTAAEVFDKQR